MTGIDARTTTEDRAPKVTVLLPVYNSASYLREAVDSILGQTYTDFELLIMDNASTDQGPSIIRSYSDPRIRYVINERNIGLAASLNRGLRLARGVYIARMDADDRSRSDRLAWQVAFMEAHPDVGVCGGDMVMEQGGGRRRRVRYPRGHEHIRVTALFHAPFSHPAVILRRSVLLANDLFYREDLRSLEDYDLWTRLVGVSRAENLPRVVLDYRCHATQMSADYSREIMRIMFDIFRRVLIRLVPEPTEDDLRVHVKIALFHDEFDLDDLGVMEAWLGRLIAANDQKKVYDARALRDVFARRWVAVCGQAAGQGMAAYRRFLGSPLSSGAVFSLAALKLLVKCLLKRASR